MEPVDAEHIEARQTDEGYLAGSGLVAAAVLALRMGRPIFLEGEPGVGKSTFADAMAAVLDAGKPIRLQCHSGLDASQALYDWVPRKVLTLRAAAEGHSVPVTDLYHSDFLVRRPILQAFEIQPAVLLVDEIDRAEDEFEACLLEVLESGTVSIPEIGSQLHLCIPFVVLTSNQTREIHDALKRRCIYHWIEHPDRPREVRILQRRVDRLVGAPRRADRRRDASAPKHRRASVPRQKFAVDTVRGIRGFPQRSWSR